MNNAEITYIKDILNRIEKLNSIRDHLIKTDLALFSSTDFIRLEEELPEMNKKYIALMENDLNNQIFDLYDKLHRFQGTYYREV